MAKLLLVLFMVKTSVQLTVESDLEKKIHDTLDSQVTLVSVYRREDPTFIQGLYFCPEKRELLESSGMEGESRT